MWLGWAFAFTGITFVGYFSANPRTGARSLQPWRRTAGPCSGALFFTAATYINAGWMREQVCIYMCPYARFQSAMFDKDTLIVSYDAARGEPRGSRKRSAHQADTGNLGDCIDCQLCVQVCPVGIDIRDGLQYQCIGCAHCMDACDQVMEKMNYPTGPGAAIPPNTRWPARSDPLVPATGAALATPWCCCAHDDGLHRIAVFNRNAFELRHASGRAASSIRVNTDRSSRQSVQPEDHEQDPAGIRPTRSA